MINVKTVKKQIAVLILYLRKRLVDRIEMDDGINLISPTSRLGGVLLNEHLFFKHNSNNNTCSEILKMTDTASAKPDSVKLRRQNGGDSKTCLAD